MSAISKRKLIGMSKFNLMGSWQMYISTGAAVGVNFIVGLIVGLASESEYGGGNIDAVMFGMSVALGAVMCAAGLKFALVNGVSRRTYYISVLFSALIAAVAYALLTYVLMLITHSVSHTNDVYYFLYCMTQFNWAGMYFFEFGFLLLGIALGYFVAIVMYRTRRTGKLVLLTASLILAAIITLISFFVNIWPPIGNFFLSILGFNAQSPFIGMATLIGIAVILLAGTFLIVRRADIRG